MAEFDQRGQQVNTQINAENVTIISADNGASRIKAILDSETKKYLEMGFSIISHTNSKAILSRRRKTTISDWFKFVNFLWKLLVMTVRMVYKVETQALLHEKMHVDLQRIGKTVLGLEKDWVRIEVDMMENVKVIFEPPLLNEIEGRETN